jgi:hypothetical protein
MVPLARALARQCQCRLIAKGRHWRAPWLHEPAPMAGPRQRHHFAMDVLLAPLNEISFTDREGRSCVCFLWFSATRLPFDGPLTGVIYAFRWIYPATMGRRMKAQEAHVAYLGAGLMRCRLVRRFCVFFHHAQRIRRSYGFLSSSVERPDGPAAVRALLACGRAGHRPLTRPGSRSSPRWRQPKSPHPDHPRPA